MKTDILAEALISRLKEKGQTVSSAESCTGGGVGHVLTAVSGSSAVFAGGVISYTNQVKEKILGVPAEILEEHGAVSSQTALTMAQGVRKLLGTDWGISVTGLAGPNSDDSGKPVGLVYVAASGQEKEEVRECFFSGDRSSVRAQAVEDVLRLLDQMIE